MTGTSTAPIPPYKQAEATERLVAAIESVAIPFIYNALRASYFHKKYDLEIAAQTTDQPYRDLTETDQFNLLMVIVDKINIQPTKTQQPQRQSISPVFDIPKLGGFGVLVKRGPDGKWQIPQSPSPTPATKVPMFPIIDRDTLISSMKAIYKMLTAGESYPATLSERCDINKQLLHAAENIRTRYFMPSIDAAIAGPFHLAEIHAEEKFRPYAGVEALNGLKENLDLLTEWRTFFSNPMGTRYPPRVPRQ